MSGTIVEVGVALEDFALEHTLTVVEDLSCEAERLVAEDIETVIPFLWVEAPPPALDEIEDAFATDETVDQVELIAELDGERLYRMSWVKDVDILVQTLLEENGTVLAARGNAEEWEMRLLFPTREALTRTHHYCQNSGVEWDLYTVYNVDEGRQGRYGLTDGQHDALVAAFERGFYEIPRNIDQSELADDFGISHQALSERLRRGHKVLVKNTLVIGPRDYTNDP